MSRDVAISHHPSDETLLRYAAGRLPAGPSLVVAIHLEACPACCARVGVFAALGGRLIEDETPQPLAETALADVMARIDGQGDRPPPPDAAPSLPTRHAAKPAPSLPFALPRALAPCEIGRWRWSGPGLRMSRVTLPQAPDARLTLLRVGPGRPLPEHGHAGLEFTQVLTGSFSDAFGRYRPGDLAEMDSEVEHQPVVDREGECICLVAFEGEMVLSGLLGRLLQPFVRL